MKITVIGSGYVGSVTGASLSKKGHDVLLCDISQEKVDTINAGKSPIYEPGLEEVIRQKVEQGKLKATTGIKDALLGCDIAFICVGTPPGEDGSTDLSYLESAANMVAEVLKEREGYLLVVIKSTVPPGTTDRIAGIIGDKSGKEEGKGFGVAMNPEFLREGQALRDFENPDRTILGVRSNGDEKLLREVFASYNCPFVVGIPKTAEMIKYVSNCILANRLSFVNEVCNSCKDLGAETEKVLEAVGLDHRIGKHFLQPGIGFGGSCLPKDITSLIHTIKESGGNPTLLEAVVEVNNRQPEKFVEMLKKKIGSVDRDIVVLGLSFKAGTDDIRESPAIKIARLLTEEGSRITVYDPKAMENAKKVLGDSVEYAEGLAEAVGKSDVVLVLSDWDEFKKPELYEGKMVFEGRKLFKGKSPENFEGISW